MFGYRRRLLELVDSTNLEVIGLGYQADRTNRLLRIVMSNQEVFNAYAAQIAEQNAQIKAAFAVIFAEIENLKNSVEAPLDTSAMDAAVQQLSDAVDQVESISAPVVVDEPAAADGSGEG